MVPIPKDASVQYMPVDPLLGYIIIRIGTIELHVAASATPSRNLKHKTSHLNKKHHEIVNILNLFNLKCHKKYIFVLVSYLKR